MKIRYTDDWGMQTETVEVQQFVYGSLTNHPLTDGALERAEETARETARAFARLVELLVNRGKLSAEEVVAISGRFMDKADFIAG